MKIQKINSEDQNNPAYERPRVVRVAVQTTREHLQWQFSDSGTGVCSNHNHATVSAGNGCDFPQ